MVLCTSASAATSVTNFWAARDTSLIWERRGLARETSLIWGGRERVGKWEILISRASDDVYFHAKLALLTDLIIYIIRKKFLNLQTQTDA